MLLFEPAPFMANRIVMPVETPIACQVCKGDAPLTFSGTVRQADAGRLGIFNAKTHQSMGFVVPANFRGVTSSDGAIKDAPLDSARPGLLARVTYRTIDGKRVPSQVLLLTIAQCRALMAAERISQKRSSECPD